MDTGRLEFFAEVLPEDFDGDVKEVVRKTMGIPAGPWFDELYGAAAWSYMGVVTARFPDGTVQAVHRIYGRWDVILPQKGE